MAYSPVEQGRLLEHPELASIAADLGLTPPQLALAWVLQQPAMIAIPKAGTLAHVRENRLAADVTLPTEIRNRLEAAFPMPGERVPLEML